MFPRRCDGSFLHTSRVLPGGHANASTALATFPNPPSHCSDRPPSPLLYSSVTSPVAHQNSGGINYCRISNAGAGIGENHSSVAWVKGEESESTFSGNAGMTAAVFPPGGVFVNKSKKKMVDINHFHVFLAHAHSSALKATALQHGFQLVGELAPCSRCSMEKGIRAPTPHHTTSRAADLLGMVHIDTAGPFPESLGGSRYVVIFVDSASRFQRPYRTREKSTSVILGVIQRFVADMGVPRAFRTDNGAEYTKWAFVQYCNSLRILRDLTAPYT